MNDLRLIVYMYDIYTCKKKIQIIAKILKKYSEDFMQIK